MLTTNELLEAIDALDEEASDICVSMEVHKGNDEDWSVIDLFKSEYITGESLSEGGIVLYLDNGREVNLMCPEDCEVIRSEVNNKIKRITIMIDKNVEYRLVNMDLD